MVFLLGPGHSPLPWGRSRGIPGRLGVHCADARELSERPIDRDVLELPDRPDRQVFPPSTDDVEAIRSQHKPTGQSPGPSMSL